METLPATPRRPAATCIGSRRGDWRGTTLHPSRAADFAATAAVVWEDTIQRRSRSLLAPRKTGLKTVAHIFADKGDYYGITDGLPQYLQDRADDGELGLIAQEDLRNGLPMYALPELEDTIAWWRGIAGICDRPERRPCRKSQNIPAI